MLTDTWPSRPPGPPVLRFARAGQLHKFTDDLANAESDPRAAHRLANFEAVLANNPQAAVLDPLPGMPAAACEHVARMYGYTDTHAQTRAPAHPPPRSVYMNMSAAQSRTFVCVCMLVCVRARARAHAHQEYGHCSTGHNYSACSRT